MKIPKLSLLFVAFIALGACQQQKQTLTNDFSNNQTPHYSISQNLNSAEGQSTFTIQDTLGQPLIGAEVLVGMSLNNPFPNNFLTTDIRGQIIIPSNWSEQPVTISYPGFIRTTYFGVNPGDHIFQLRNSTPTAKYELKGKTTNFGRLNNDDNVADFGLVMQSLTRNELFSFDLGMILSSEMDTLNLSAIIGGFDAKIPSNVTFPHQVENYVFDLTFDKPIYRTYFKTKGKKQTYAIHGRFPFSQVVDQFKNKTPFPALINYFEFVSGSIRTVDLQGNQSLDIPVNEITFADPIKVKTTPVANDKTLITLSASETDGYIYPTDMKKIDGASKTVNFKTGNFGSKLLISALKRTSDFYAAADEEKQMAISVTLVPVKSKEIVQATPLDLIPPPTGDVVTWKETLPSKQAGVEPLATYAVLSHAQRFGPTSQNVEKVWEAYAPRWVPEMSLPEWPEHKASELYSAAEEFNSWEVTYIGSDNSNSEVGGVVSLGPDLVKFATHISYNKAEFQ